jgi:hypothetical protein
LYLKSSGCSINAGPGPRCIVAEVYAANDLDGNDLSFEIMDMLWDGNNLTCNSDWLPPAVITGLQTNRWYQISCSYNTSKGNVTTYLDGKLFSTGNTGTKGNHFPFDHVFIGGDDGTYSGTPNPGFDGYIDNVTIFQHALGE